MLLWNQRLKAENLLLSRLSTSVPHAILCDSLVEPGLVEETPVASPLSILGADGDDGDFGDTRRAPYPLPVHPSPSEFGVS
jgi:hypothetical protein